MSSDSLTVMRLLLAAINGALFAFGLFLLVDFLYRRPRRLRIRMKELAVRAGRAEPAQHEGVLRPGTVTAEELEQRIERIREALRLRRRNPRYLMNVTFGALMILLAVISLLNLLFPAWIRFI